VLNCPACDHPLDQDFGMVTCSNCGAVLMIDFSGKVTAEDPSAVYEDPAEDSEFEAEDDNTTEDFFEDPLEDNPTEDDLIEDDPYVEEDLGVEAFDENDQEIEPVEAQAVDEPEADTEDEPVQEVSEIKEGEAEEEETEEVFAMAQEPDTEPVDITNYANSETSNLEEGVLVYDVKISRLDSKDLREALKYVLMDEKLKLNHHQYMNQVRGGEVLIADLNPIKAKRIVEQMQYFNVDISWKQKHVVMETVDLENDETSESPDGMEDANV
jgi:uncharacterized Zn finger protein (UPF0148 family)